VVHANRDAQCKRAPAARFSPAHHSFSQPVKPFGSGLAVLRTTPFLGPDLKLFPGKKNGTAKEIIDQIERELAAKKQQTDAFPRQRNQ